MNVNPGKRRKLFVDENQREYVNKIECYLENPEFVNLGMKALHLMTKQNPKFSLHMMNRNVVIDLVKEMDKFLDGYEFVEIKNNIFFAKEEYEEEEKEKRGFVAFETLRNIAMNIQNLPFFMNEGTVKILVKILEFFKEKETKFKREWIKKCFDILLGLSSKLKFRNFKGEISEELFNLIQFYLTQYEEELTDIAYQILQTMNNLFINNEEFFEKKMSKSSLIFLIDLLSFEFGSFKYDLLSRTYSLELFFKIVNSDVISKEFKKALAKLNGFVKRLIELISKKSNIDKDDISLFDNFFANADKEPRFPSDIFQLKCALILQYYTENFKKVVSPYYNELLLTCSFVKDADVSQILLKIISKFK